MITTENTIVNAPRSLNPIDATHASSHCSSRYGFISTREIINSFEQIGFMPRQVSIGRARSSKKLGFQKHLIRFQHTDLQMKVGGDSVPEVILINSHDGTTSARLSLGLFRFACSNGLIVGKTFQEYRIHHRLSGVDSFIQAAARIVDQVPLLEHRIKRYQERILSDAEVVDYATKALQLRFDKPDDDATIDDHYAWQNRLNHIAFIRRYDDSGSNLWSVFNRVQENMMVPRRGSGMRRVTSPQSEVTLNQQLWDIADEYLN